MSHHSRPSHNLDRRGFLRLGGMSLGGLVLTGSEPAGATEQAASTGTEASADVCAPTAVNIEGPFYRDAAPIRNRLDLYDHDGRVVIIDGRLVDQQCRPIAAAMIEFWQAGPDGRYDNRTREMRYRCRIETDAQGGWQLRTLIPGFYLNGARFRPAHIHVKVWVAGVEALTTQLYFEGDPYIEGDPYVRGAPVLALLEQDDASHRATLDLTV